MLRVATVQNTHNYLVSTNFCSVPWQMRKSRYVRNSTRAVCIMYVRKLLLFLFFYILIHVWFALTTLIHWFMVAAIFCCLVSSHSCLDIWFVQFMIASAYWFCSQIMRKNNRRGSEINFIEYNTTIGTHEVNSISLNPFCIFEIQITAFDKSM